MKAASFASVFNTRYETYAQFPPRSLKNEDLLVGENMDTSRASDVHLDISFGIKQSLVELFLDYNAHNSQSARTDQNSWSCYIYIKNPLFFILRLGLWILKSLQVDILTMHHI